MELNWSTFLLEIINFLILVWLLTRFFYRPILQVINNRREDTQKILDESATLHEEAEALKASYQDRLSEWEQEQQNERRILHKDITGERKQLLDDLQHELEREREKTGILAQRQQAEEQHKLEQLALRQGAAFSAKLLTRLANPELETAIVNLVIEDLDTLSSARQQLLQAGYSDTKSGFIISSAYPLPVSSKQHIEKKLAEIIGAKIQCHYKQEHDLIAGMRIATGSWLLQASLRDELKYFTDMEHHDLD